MLDFDPWNKLLQQYVDRQGRVDYQAWKANSAQELTDWLNGLSSLNLQDYFESNEQLALWINLYNALTIAQVLKVYPINSLQPKILGIPNLIAFLFFFFRPIYPMGARRYSLNDIEHRLLRRQFNEPHLHFALVCASLGCPLLRPEAYLPRLVATQLEDDAKRFINNRDKVDYDVRSQTLYCSRIFQWYRQDFLKVAPSIPAYLQAYLNPAIDLNNCQHIRYLKYDWNLNQRTSS